MEIFKVEWANLYMWTRGGGSAVFHIERDERYWSKCFTALSDFWYDHVLPGRISKDVEGTPALDLEALRWARVQRQDDALCVCSLLLASCPAPAMLCISRPSSVKTISCV